MRARIIILIFLGLCIRSFAGLEYNSVTTNKVVAAGPNIVFTFGNGGTLTISSPNQLPENAPGALTNDGFGNIGWQVGGSGGGGGPIAVNLGQLFTNALGQLSIISGATTTNNFLYEHSPGAIHLTNDNTAISLIIYYDTSFNQDVNQLFSFYSPLQTNAWEMLAGSNVWSMNFVSLNGPDTVTNIIAITNGATPSITSFVPFDVTTENVSGSLTGIGTIQNMVLLNDTNTGVQIYTNSIYTNIFGPTGITNIWGGTTSVYTSGTQQTTNATGNSTFTPTTFAFTNGSSTLIWNGTSLIINGVSINANGAAFNSNSTLSISNAYASNLFASIGIFGAIQETNGWTNFLTSLQMTDGNGNYGGVGAGYSNWPISFGTNTYGIFTTNIGLCISNVQGLAANSANYVRVFISYTNFTSGNATEYISFAGTDIYPNLSGMGNGFQIQQKVGITTPTYMLEGYIWGTNWQGPLAVWRLSQPGGNVQYYYAGASLSSIGVTGFTNGGNYISLNQSVVLNPTTGQDVYVQNGPLWLSLVGEYIQNGFLQFNNYLFPGSNLNFGLFGYTNTIPTQITEQHGPQSILQTSNVQAMAITATNSLYLPFLTPSSLIMTGIGDLVQSVTLGTGLSFSGSTLNATGGGGSLNINTNNLNTAITNLNSLAVIVSNTWQWITNQYPGTNVTITPTNITVTGNLGYYGNGTNLQGVVTTNGAQQNYEPVFTPGSGVNGITWQPATNVDIVTTVTFSNIPPLTYYTNTSGSVQVYSVTISNQVAAVAGNATWTFAISNANSGGWSNQVVGLSTLITSISMNYTNDTIVILNTNAVLAMTNTSTGTGNVAGEVPSTGQIMTIGNATASGVASLGGNNSFTGNNGFNFPNGTNTQVTSSGITQNGGSVAISTGNLVMSSYNGNMNTNPIIFQIASIQNTIPSATRYFPGTSCVIDGEIIPTANTNACVFWPGLHSFSTINALISTGGLLVGSNVTFTVMTNNVATAVTSTVGPTGQTNTITPTIISNEWVSVMMTLGGAGSIASPDIQIAVY